MRVMVTIQHPGHVHFFRHAIRTLEDRGHRVYVFARENEVTSELLDVYGIDHEVLVGPSTSIVSLAAIQAKYELRLFRRARRIKPDVITAIGGVAAAHVSKLVRAKSVVFYDTEHAKIITSLAYPFADVICTPECYDQRIGRRQIRYPGYHELAYLHPDRFTPDETVRNRLGLDAEDRLAVCRFSSWDSSHDFGQGGVRDPAEVVSSLEDAGARVIVSSEIDLPELEGNANPLSPQWMHDLLAAADVVVSEGATTAAEAAVLGTPAIYVNTLRMGYTDELEEKHGLLFNFSEDDRHERGLEFALSLLKYRNARIWQGRLERLHAGTVDVTDVIVQVLESTDERAVLEPRNVDTPLDA